MNQIRSVACALVIGFATTLCGCGGGTAAGPTGGMGGSTGTGGSSGTVAAPARGHCAWKVTDSTGTTSTDIGCHWDSIMGSLVGVYADNADAQTGFSIQGLMAAVGTNAIQSQRFGLLGYSCFGASCKGSVDITANDGMLLTGTFMADFDSMKGGRAHIDGAIAAVCDGPVGTVVTCPQ